MLKPNAARVALEKSTAELVAQFKQKGGVVAQLQPGVGAGLKRKKYLKKPVKAD